jgi:hypothetical protein
MTTTVTSPVRVQQSQSFVVPSEWGAFTERGDTVLANLPTACRALAKHKAGKLVECDLEGRNLINSHANHVDFRVLISAMVGSGALREDRERAAAYLLEHFLATAK